MKYIVLFCLFLGIRAEDFTDSVLKEPICDINLETQKDKDDFATFAIREECSFQRFMDKQQEINCLIEKNDLNNCKEECQEEMMKIGEEIYQERIKEDVACVCDKPRNAKSIYSVQKIQSLADYIDCWDQLWKNMTEVVQTKLDQIKSEINDEDLKDQCKKYGEQHSSRCPNIIN